MVLYSLLAERVIYPYDLGLVEDPCQGVVDVPGGLQIVADGLLDYDPRERLVLGRWLDEPSVAQAFHDGRNGRGRDGQVEDPVARQPQVALDPLQARLDILVGLGVVNGSGDVEQPP